MSLISRSVLTPMLGPNPTRTAVRAIVSTIPQPIRNRFMEDSPPQVHLRWFEVVVLGWDARQTQLRGTSRCGVTYSFSIIAATDKKRRPFFSPRQSSGRGYHWLEKLGISDRKNYAEPLLRI